MSAPYRASGSDAEACARLVQHHARTFSAASRFLPAPKRRAAYAVYAFCRIADDLVDEAMRGSFEAERDLDRYEAAFQAALRGAPSDAYFRELTATIREYQIPETPFVALLDMLRTDLQPAEYASWYDLERYCGGVASTVGEMCAYVFGMPASAAARDQALDCARTLGVALQLTNILRDVGEDAARGRCYLPTDDLGKFSITRDELMQGSLRADDPRWRALMQFEIARARTLYAMAAPGLAMLQPDAQCCARICASGYAGILDAIERRNFDSLTGRAHVGALRKVVVMARAWMDTRRERSSTQGAGMLTMADIAAERLGMNAGTATGRQSEAHEHRHAH